MSENASKSRIVWVDQLRAVAFFFVILGHVQLAQRYNTLIYSFHVPLFFIISGMTLNPQKILKTPLKDLIFGYFKRLIIPYFWLNLFMFPIWICLYKFLFSAKTTAIEIFRGIFYSNGNEIQTPSNALWFLTVLFLANVLISVIIKLTKNNTYYIGIAVAVCAALGYLDQSETRVWHINVAFTAVAFMFLGYVFMGWYKKNADNIKSVGAVKWILLIAVSAIIWIVLVKSNGYASLYRSIFGETMWMFYAAAIFGSLTVTLIVMRLPKLKSLTYIGQNTMLYLAVHAKIIRYFEKAFAEQMSHQRYTVPLAILIFFALIPLCMLFNRFFPFAVGKSTPKNCGKDMISGQFIMTALVLISPLLTVIDIYYPQWLSGYPLAIVLAIWIILSVFTTFALRKYLKTAYLMENKSA